MKHPVGSSTTFPVQVVLDKSPCPMYHETGEKFNKFPILLWTLDILTDRNGVDMDASAGFSQTAKTVMQTGQRLTYPHFLN